MCDPGLQAKTSTGPAGVARSTTGFTEMIEKRVSDGTILRLIGKWINVGVIEEGRLLHSETGTGQGQVISPLLANIYLHHVLDEWFETVVKPRLKGEAYEVRFADDFILCFQYREDAEKVLEVLCELRSGKLVQVLTDYEVATNAALWALYPSAKHLLPRMRALLDFLAEWFRDAKSGTTIPAVSTLAVVAESANVVPRAKVQLGAG